MKPKYKYSVIELIVDWFNDDNSTLNDLLKKLEEKVPQGRWKPKTDEKYYFVNDSGDIVYVLWDNDKNDIFRYQISNCFPVTKEGKKQAEAYRQKLIDLGKGE